MNWFDCFRCGFMTAKTSREIWENPETSTSPTVGLSWLDLGCFVAPLFPFQDLERPQLILCLEYVEDESPLGDGRKLRVVQEFQSFEF